MRKNKLLIVMGILTLVILLAGCGNKQTGYQDITGDQMLEKVQKGDLQIVDVRTVEEFAEGHIKGSVNIPLDVFANKYTSINKDKDVYVVCASGARSTSAANYLSQQGYTKVNNLTGGLASYPGELVK